MAARGSLIIIFPEQILSVNTSSISSTSSVTTSGQSITTNTEDGQIYSVACTLADGYKIVSANFSPSTNGGSIGSFTDSAINMMAGAGGIDGTLTITVAQSTVKAVSSANLARFKQKCDETYAKIGEGGGGVNLYSHQLTIDGSYYYFISSSETPCNSLSELQGSNIIFGSKDLEISAPSETKFVISVFSSKLLYINVTGTFQGATGANFDVLDLSSVTISDTVTPL